MKIKWKESNGGFEAELRIGDCCYAFIDVYEEVNGWFGEYHVGYGEAFKYVTAKTREQCEKLVLKKVKAALIKEIKKIQKNATE